MPGRIAISGWEEVGSTETRPLAIELAASMDPGDIPASPSSTLTDLLTGAAFPEGLLGDPAIVGTVVTQSVAGLAPGRRYRLVIAVGMGGTKVTDVAVLISVPF